MSTKMEYRSALPIDHETGRGDSLEFTNNNTEANSWKLKKLANGTKTPINTHRRLKSKEKVGTWTDATDAHGKPFVSSTSPAETSPPTPLKTPPDVIHCPLCYDPVIEATITLCGHTFCHDCIFTWLKLKNWCPICQEPVENSSCCFGQPALYRVYSIDALIENHLYEFNTDVQQRFMERRTLRLEKARKEMKCSQPFKYLKTLNRQLWLYFQSKGVVRGIARLFVTFWRKTFFFGWSYNFPNGILFLCSILIAYALGRYTCDLNPGHFLAYMWDAVKKYPGTKYQFLSENAQQALGPF